MTGASSSGMLAMPGCISSASTPVERVQQLWLVGGFVSVARSE